MPSVDIEACSKQAAAPVPSYSFPDTKYSRAHFLQFHASMLLAWHAIRGATVIGARADFLHSALLL